jgi:hypothetical protein
MELMTADGLGTSGYALRQTFILTQQTISGTYVEMAGQLYKYPIANGGHFYYAQAGLMTMSAGTLTTTFSENDAGTKQGTGSYAVGSDGKITVTIASPSPPYTGYVVDQIHFLLADWRSDALSGSPPSVLGNGEAFLQNGAPFAADGLSGEFALVTYGGPPVVFASVTSQGTTGVADLWYPGPSNLTTGVPVSNIPWSIAPTGAATISIGGLNGPYNLYAISPSRALLINSDLISPA